MGNLPLGRSIGVLYNSVVLHLHNYSRINRAVLSTKKVAL